ncbi:MAG: YXWGXW repeat-containing protein, partial [Edaphobacter sp.]
MTSNRLFKSSITATALAAALIATPAFAQAQYNPGQNPAQNPGQMGENNGQSTSPPAALPADPNAQYGAQPGQYGQQDQQGYSQDQNQQDGPTAAQEAAATITGVQQAPPEIPDYQQPEAPGDGYIWTPGYWAWTGDGYEWVNGAWVEPPYADALWTPGFWGGGYSGYSWYPGYWGPYVGYYGGLNYGFGYFGIGFYGGYWNSGRFWYNRSYCNIGRGYGFHTYDRRYAGYSGRPGGAAFVHNTSIANRGFRGSTINGRSFNNGAVHN